MKKLTLLSVIAALGMAASAQASPIVGDLLFGGGTAQLNASQADLATSINAISGATVSLATDTFAANGVLTGAGVNFNTPWSFTGGGSQVPLWTLTSGTFTFDLTSSTYAVDSTQHSLAISGVGTVSSTISGLTPTPGNFYFTAQGKGIAKSGTPNYLFSWSADNHSPVPDSGNTLSLLGLSFAALGFIGRRKLGM